MWCAVIRTSLAFVGQDSTDKRVAESRVAMVVAVAVAAAKKHSYVRETCTLRDRLQQSQINLCIIWEPHTVASMMI